MNLLTQEKRFQTSQSRTINRFAVITYRCASQENYTRVSFPSVKLFQCNSENRRDSISIKFFSDVCQESFNIGDASERGPDTLGHEKARLWPGQVGEVNI